MPKISFGQRAEDCVLHMAARSMARNVPVSEIAVTAGPQSKRWGVTRTHATRLLKRMCDEGYLYREKILDERVGHVGRVLYRMTPDCQTALLFEDAPF